MLVVRILITIFLLAASIIAALWFAVGRRLYARFDRYCVSHDQAEAEHRAELEEEARLRKVAEEELKREFGLEHLHQTPTSEPVIQITDHPDSSQ